MGVYWKSARAKTRIQVDFASVRIEGSLGPIIRYGAENEMILEVFLPSY